MGNFPVVEAHNTGGTNTVNEHVVPLPADIVTGELLLVLIGINNIRVWTVPSGWAGVYGVSSGLGLLIYKYADGSEGSTLTLSHDGSTTRGKYISYRISGAQGAPEAETAVDDSATPDPPSLSPSWGSAKTLWLSAAHLDGTPTVESSPSGYGNLVVVLDGGGGPRQAFAYRELETATEDPGVWTLDSSRFHHVSTIAVRPASPVARNSHLLLLGVG